MDVSIAQAIQIALAHRQAGRLAEAEAVCRQVLKAVPGEPGSLQLLGLIALQRGANAEAADCLSRTIPTASTQLNLGIALHRLGRFDDAVEVFRRARSLGADGGKLDLHLGISLRTLRRHGEAIASLAQAVGKMPDSVDAHANLAEALRAAGRRREAIVHYRRAIALAPGWAEVHNNLGLALKDLGRPAEAVPCFRRAIELEPRMLGAYSNLLLALSGLASTTADEYRDAAVAFGRQVMADCTPYLAWRTDARGANVPRLRVGIVSGDLRAHPVGYFLESVLAQLDPARVECVAYPTNALADDLTARIRSRFVAWRPVHGLDDRAAASLVHDDGIHVLLDLAGHTEHNRLGIFGWKPAPLQVSWLGYFASVGLPTIDYVLVDPLCAPVSVHAQFVERLWYLPETRLCFTPPVEACALPDEPPFVANGYVTFGCVQNMAKLSDEVLALWASILARVPGARLRIQNSEMGAADARAEFLQRLAGLGVDPARVEAVGPMARGDYLQAYARVDLLLDTFPYTGGTTTCEALWMGVPTVTRIGDTLVSRQGASLLSNAGLPDWVADSPAAYVDLAVRCAGDGSLIRTLRRTLREQLRASVLCDAGRFARHLEDALHGMWRAGPAATAAGERGETGG